MATKSKIRTMVVAGDMVVDWNLSLPGGAGSVGEWWGQKMNRVDAQRGGAALLEDLARELPAAEDRAEAARTAEGEKSPERTVGKFEVQGAGLEVGKARPGGGPQRHSYAHWRLFEKEKGKNKKKGKDAGKKKDRGKANGKDKEQEEKEQRTHVWRVEGFLGLDRAEPGKAAEDGNPMAARIGVKVEGDAHDTALVVLDDAALGFRERRDLWPAAVTDEKSQCPILLKISRPVAKGELWEHLITTAANRLTVLMAVDDLRQEEIAISREISWERTAQDAFDELIRNPKVNALARCAHVIVSFGASGALLVSRVSGEKGGLAHECRLVFDPVEIEGTWEERRPGKIIGRTACLAAALARRMLQKVDAETLLRGIKEGICGIRALHEEGYGGPKDEDKVVFPHARIADAIVACEGGLPDTKVKRPEMGGGFWRILEERYRGGIGEVSYKTVKKGLEKAITGVPVGIFGKLATVDRREIESFRSIARLIRNYLESKTAKPLCIAVFGPPGSGKSFGVREVAKGILGDELDPLEFNLSQFRGPEELASAFHQVRDATLLGKGEPLVFWDEFDARLAGAELGWLKYFLSPMQDGRFRDGQLEHPVGRAVFVFAGGTCATMEKFNRGAEDEGFVGAKGPDFVSRLKGFVNILGPNPQEAEEDAPPDSYHLLRRAILLRSLLKGAAAGIFPEDGPPNIDDGVLRAMLRTARYRHGARSMEAVVLMSPLAGRARFERSCLPPEEQLALHVDSRDFLALMESLEPEGDVLEQLAEEAQEIYRERMESTGGKFDPSPDNDARINRRLGPYAQLDEPDKEQNRDNVRDIFRKLRLWGCTVTPALPGTDPHTFPPEELEALAKEEHERWLLLRLGQGWGHGPKLDDKLKLNPAICPWEKLDTEVLRARYGDLAPRIGPGPLDEEQREKDRAFIRGMGRILARMGWAIVKIGTPPGCS